MNNRTKKNITPNVDIATSKLNEPQIYELADESWLGISD